VYDDVKFRIHAYCDVHTQELLNFAFFVISTRSSVIYTRRVRIPHAECDLYTQNVISTRSVSSTGTNVISTRTRLNSTHRVLFPKAECDFHTHYTVKNSVLIRHAPR
jgi:hypothetical protein